ncbi:esterase/lipase family protein [Sphingomonas sp. R86521]|uniref:esterase/lipase family protein n=1 Tax=Sphingomonas sp. R86521 TaxID=3093860 RepID=UPI0036D2CAF7
MTEVLIFVPGTLGSELFDDEGQVWPGNLKDGVFGFSKARFERLLAPDLRVGGVIRKVAKTIDVYESWLRSFGRLRSRESGAALFDETGDLPTLLTVPYDWRRSIEDAAEVLAGAIERAAGLHGHDARIHVAAHSMGGLVARYLLQSGRFADRAGYDRVETLLTFGTPNKGAAMALAAATGHEAARFLSAEQTKELANDPRYPSLYQLFPHEGAGVVWDTSPGGRLVAQDVFADRIVARSLGLNEDHLDAALALQKVLRGPRPIVRTFMFVGTRYETLTHFLHDGRSLTPVRTSGAGDGTVPLQGAVLEDHEIRFTDRNHINLIDAAETLHALQTLFHADGLLSAVQQAEVVIDVSDLIVEHGGHIEVGLSFSTLDREIEGTLHLERARPAPGAGDVADADFDMMHPEHPTGLLYGGPELASLHVRLPGLTGPAVYRPILTLGVGGARFVGPSFVVRRPE